MSPVKSVAEGLSVILQVSFPSRPKTDPKLLEKESVKGSEFVDELAQAQIQAIRIENNKFDLSSDNTATSIRDASTALLTAIVEFLDASLLYFSGNVAGSRYDALLE
jgi:hypothetical protein